MTREAEREFDWKGPDLPTLLTDSKRLGSRALSVYAEPEVRRTAMYQDAMVRAQASATTSPPPPAPSYRAIARRAFRRVVEQQLRRGFEVGDHAWRLVDAADPADQRRQPDLLQHPRDREVARARRPLMHRAGDDARSSMSLTRRTTSASSGAARARRPAPSPP